jgi:hypothetical protein
MRISKEQLQKIIAEEVRAHVKKKLMSESVSEPRTVKATPAMLKRIIAEEAAKINEASPGRPMDGRHDPKPHPDDAIFRDRSNKRYEDLQDEWAAAAARDEEVRKKALACGTQYYMDDRFHEGLTGGVFYDNGSLVCNLRRNNNSACAKEVIDYAFKYANDRLHNAPLYLSGLINILLEHEMITPSAAKAPVDHITLATTTPSPFDLDYKK